jgi:large subunit ribosomal protein L30
MSAARTSTKSKKLRITQIRSQIGSQQQLKKVLAGLGLGRIGRSVVRPDDPCIRGMVNKVTHLVSVEEVEG